MSPSSPAPFEALSRLLHYPDAACRENIARASSVLAAKAPDAAARVDRFAERTSALSVQQFQELFTQTFDLSPVCSLEVGWQLYGEEYVRGGFLVSMRSLLRQYGVEESVELPDHLTHLLPLLDRMEPREGRYFIDKYLAPALAKMLAPFEGKDNPYEEVLRALEDLMAEVKESKPEEAAHG